MTKFDFSTYLSPFTWRYGSQQMRELFSEESKFKTWRRLWVSLARSQHKAGLVSKKELEDLEKNQEKLEINRILEVEKDTSHDVVSAIREFAEKAKLGGGKIHLGATSQDIVDNAEMLRNKKALDLIERRLITLLKLFAGKIDQYADLACMGYTHLQPAEPTTVGYRLAFYAQDVLTDLEFLRFVKKIIKGKGLKGAVGTAASYKSLLENSKMSSDLLEKHFMSELQLESVLISTQVYPRKFDFLLLNSLSSISSSLSKFAFDLRIMQSPGFGEWQEPFGKKQVGSSAMPFKKNPLTSEKVCSLARYINFLPAIALENASASLLERTLDDSANKRVIMPEGFLATDEILATVEKLLKGLVINEKRIKQNLETYAPFAATELIIIEAVKKGANRQDMHELLREVSMQAWEDVQSGGKNSVKDLLKKNKELERFLNTQQIEKLMDVNNHLGTASTRARKLAREIKTIT